jgi:putative transposase
MPQSLSLLIAHLIFSTKGRRPFLNTEIRGPLHAYLATLARNADCHCYRVGGREDHVHLAIALPRTAAIADLVRHLKASSSNWLKTQSIDIKDFSWQRGYACISISPKDVDALVDYIDRQEEHHRKRTFQEEYRMFLDKYGMEYDEAYVWD